MPAPRKNEKQKDFVSRCMSDKEARKSFPDQKQRVAFCNSQFRNRASHILTRTQEDYDGRNDKEM